ncbi:hypothetical protein [Deinococcus sp.]|uniref:hypothetical protein n=1 Tax=Deinococcus sp. TaxID=47478 RepID=UPI003CC6AB54
MLLLALALGQAQAATGLLLGLRADRTHASLYRTLYITDDGSGVRLRAQDRSTVLVATPQGQFLRAAVSRLSSPDGHFFRDHLGIGWPVTVGHPAPLNRELVPCVPVSTSVSLLFVSPALVSFEGHAFPPELPSCTEADFFPGAELYHLHLSPPQPGILQSVFSDELDSLQQSLAPIADLNRLFGLQTWTELQAAWRKTFAGLPALTRQSLTELGSEQADPGNWAVVRRSGRWALRARVAGFTATATFDVPVPLPVSITGWDTLALPWASIRARVPDARDAFSSPDGHLLGVMTGRVLNVYRLVSGRFGTPDLSVPLEAPESAVSIGWASGDEVARWAGELDRFSVP